MPKIVAYFIIATALLVAASFCLAALAHNSGGMMRLGCMKMIEQTPSAQNQPPNQQCWQDP
jgi:hypothetical protein